MTPTLWGLFIGGGLVLIGTVCWSIIEIVRHYVRHRWPDRTEAGDRG
jgi:hypothetical protein